MYGIIQEICLFVEEQLPMYSEKVQIGLRLFLQYFKRYWIGIVTPGRFCVADNAITTNNHLESINHQLGVKLGQNPGLISLIGTFISLNFTPFFSLIDK